MAVRQGDQIHLEAFCPACEAVYYRTARPLVVGQDQLTPDLFVPIKSDTPPPNPEKPECPTCKSPLRFITAATAPAETKPAEPMVVEPIPELGPGAFRKVDSPVAQSAERPALTREVGGSSPSRGASVDVLFAVEPDEQVVDIKDAGGAYLVVTSKRIVRVSYE